MAVATTLVEAISASWAFEGLVRETLERHRPLWEHLAIPPAEALGLEQATFRQDTQLATDYVCAITPAIVPVAVRVRSFHHLGQYGSEFVLRDSAPPTIATEAQKVLTNPKTAQLYLYAFSDATGTAFAQYLLVDLTRLRSAWATPHGQESLDARQVRFSAHEAGLALPVTGLIETGCLLAARLAHRTLRTQRQARAILQTTTAYEALQPQDRTRVEILLMQLLFTTVEFRHGDLL
jgi:hypothetical protein